MTKRDLAYGRQLAASLWRRASKTPTSIVSRFSHRKRDVWIFGNQRGFRDNTRYLAEHVASHHLDIQVWWLARTAAELNQARTAGLHAVKRGTARAMAIQLRAGAAFLGEGFEDLQIEYLSGAFLVHLEHGKGLKRIQLDAEGFGLAGASRVLRPLSRIQRWFLARRLSKIDLVVAQGEMAKTFFTSAYGGRPDRIQVLGTPRFDVILRGANDGQTNQEIRAGLGVSERDYLVLWLPTWRENGDEGWLPHLAAAELDRTLNGTDVVIVARPHPNSDLHQFQIALPKHPRVRFAAGAEHDTNVLLGVADAIVTDYSSVAFDFAILHRPILFFAPDLEEYTRQRELYQPLGTIATGALHIRWDSLLSAIASIRAGSDQWEPAFERVHAIAQNLDRPGSSERITAAVANRLGITQLPSLRP